MVFDLVQDLKYHLLDLHCRDFAKEVDVLEGLDLEDKVELAPSRKKQKGSIDEGPAKDTLYYFVDETAKMTRQHGSATEVKGKPYCTSTFQPLSP